uniref:Aspartate/glutamate/uridylate kinase domain-containing protein n=1 Tax=Chromera velia CCMP2878 TaxID=1169474 RepID=A0A0G4ICF5_9ALVE|eukprot:Cvel_13099.t1-p1 / transcript=Cvel_13099.t1 / gene=Cvel_13099 / organism=Chromera_velia_CCMP2878 / gene_product=Glutamate 5-kinase, putative / transcript_product=Glutamate 5-kinase, putative / location=Cvel_scaffold882:50272-56777(+) / protein_length=566 / sequence_SO=supercontig / SO=protein_coding / is_pseudo=false
MEKLIVVKVGTSTLMDPKTQSVSLENISSLVQYVVNLRKQGWKVVVVTSGAIGYGCAHLRMSARPSSIQGKQAAAAIGQSHLMRVYEDLFRLLGYQVAQLLISRHDFVSKARYINFHNAVKELLDWDAVPIVNENDAVATEELRFGDNDTLSAHVAVSIGARWLFLLTDVDSLYTADPRSNPDARPVAAVTRMATLQTLVDFSGAGSAFGTGGMKTKIIAAQLATAAGVHCALLNGSFPRRMAGLLENSADLFTKADEVGGVLTVSPLGGASKGLVGEEGGDGEEEGAPAQAASSLCAGGGGGSVQRGAKGTIFKGLEVTQNLRIQRKWILSLPPGGTVEIDSGATAALGKHQSLLAVGCVRISGSFEAGEALCVVGPLPSSSSFATATEESGSKATLREHGKEKEGLTPAGAGEFQHLPDTQADAEGGERRTEPSPSPSSSPTVSEARRQAADEGGREKERPGASPDRRSQREPETGKDTDKEGYSRGHSADRDRGVSRERKERERERRPPVFEIARCVSNYSSSDLEKICGKRSSEIETVLGFAADPEVAHRANIILVTPPDSE